MRLSSMADYAVVTMCAAARHCGGMRASAADLARETGLPQPTVRKLVSLLVRAGLLRSMRGAGGGLQLARPPAAISLAEIVEAVEGPILALEADGAARPHWGLVNATLRGALAGVPLTRLIAATAPVPHRPAAPPRPASMSVPA